ncbi:MAG TPA: glycosyltransferase family 2 protein [Caldilineaceae bacterium]|nr:glycosyltransferase family 2 protein [Caldilineaceae bacterium]
MAAAKPRVSIGMPVYNGEEYLEPTLDALLAQTYTDFELVISDNGSTDRTEAICRAYAGRDARIRYYRAEKNQGAAWNYNRVFALAQGEYFKWAAHDDLCAPEFVARCVEVLDQHPEVILCYSRTRAINEQNEVLRDYPAKPAANAPQPSRRFYEFICVPHPCVAVFGLIRRECLARTPLIGNYSASDRPLLGELSLMGQFYEIPEYLFFYRNHPKQSWQAYPIWRARQDTWFDPAKRGRLTFPHWRLLREHWKAVNKTRLGLYERAKCYACLVWWVRKHWRHLANNLAYVQL